MNLPRDERVSRSNNFLFLHLKPWREGREATVEKWRESFENYSPRSNSDFMVTTGECSFYVFTFRIMLAVSFVVCLFRLAADAATVKLRKVDISES